MVMVFNATFNNISVILWQSILLVEETGVPGENHRPVARFIGGGNRSTRRKPPTCRKFNWWRKPEYPEKTTDLSQVKCGENRNTRRKPPTCRKSLSGGSRRTRRKPPTCRKSLLEETGVPGENHRPVASH